MKDSFGRTINTGDVIWVPAQVTGSDASGNIKVKILQIPTQPAANAVVANGEVGQTSNPLEGDRPPH